MTDTATIGKSSRLPATTCGVTPSGSDDCRVLIAALTFCSALSRSVPKVKLMLTVELPVADCDEVVSTPLMPRTACSIGLLTRSLTISGEAPR